MLKDLRLFRRDSTRRVSYTCLSGCQQRGRISLGSPTKWRWLLGNVNLCPEVCPTTLFEVAGYLQALGDKGKALKTYFFSIDPERGTPSIMHAYVTAFSDRITGITGKPEEMKKVTDGMMIHAARQEGSNPNYHMSHTTSLLMFGADGRLKGLLPYGEPEDEAVARIRSSLLKS